MQTLVLNAETANLSIELLMKQVDKGGVEVRDSHGRVIAFVISPTDRQGWTYVEANLDLNQHSDDVRNALARNGGVTTAQLLQSAASATRKDVQR